MTLPEVTRSSAPRSRYACAVHGAGSRAREVLSTLVASSEHGYSAAQDVAAVYVGLGDIEPAFALLDKAFKEGFGRLIWLNIDPLFARLRPDPRFSAFLTQIGIEQPAERAITSGALR